MHVDVDVIPNRGCRSRADASGVRRICVHLWFHSLAATFDQRRLLAADKSLEPQMHTDTTQIKAAGTQ